MNVHFRGLSRVGFVLLGVALIAAPAARAEDKPHFSAKDIRRSYGFTCSGTAFGAPFAQLGQVSCDGKDTCAGTGVLNANGVATLSSLVGTYTVEKNGLGFITYNVYDGTTLLYQLPIEFVIMDGGREIRGLPIVPGYAVICELKEQ